MALEYKDRQTALIVPVPEAERAISEWRERFDPTARAGVPAHISMLFPFIPGPEIDTGVLDALDNLFGARAEIDFELSELARFPDGNLYLRPEPAEPFKELTEAVWERWPAHPPYGGQFQEIIPHLTVAIDPSQDAVTKITATLADAFPISARATKVLLLEYRAPEWRTLKQFSFRA